MALSLEQLFLLACKNGDIESVRLAISLQVDINFQAGWPLRRAIRYNHPQIWESLLLDNFLQVNLANRHGLTALHTACRFNIGSAVSDLLRRPAILINERTVLGSTPLMVAVKYVSKQAVQILVRDRRVDLDVVDNRQRRLEDVVGLATAATRRPSSRQGSFESDKAELLAILQEERRLRQEQRRGSLEDETGLLQDDGSHRTRVFGKLKELLEELRELHKAELLKVEARQEEESRQQQARMEEQLGQLMSRQEQERLLLMDGLMQEKREQAARQQEETSRLLRRQEEATHFLQRSRSDTLSNADTQQKQPQQQQQQALQQQHIGGSPVKSNVTSRRTSIVGPTANKSGSGGTSIASNGGATASTPVGAVLAANGTGPIGGGGSSVAASVSPWELATPDDEGYLTASRGEEAALLELPEMIHSALCKELECPICMEVMAPPSRIWQCKMGHVICETCKDRVWRESTGAVGALGNAAISATADNVCCCPTCKTAPFIGRNLALERVARSLFLSK